MLIHIETTCIRITELERINCQATLLSISEIIVEVMYHLRCTHDCHMWMSHVDVTCGCHMWMSHVDVTCGCGIMYHHHCP